jgi:hypothetical protein
VARPSGGGGTFMWDRPFPWFNTTEPFWAEGQAISVDRGEEGEVGSETRYHGIFLNMRAVLRLKVSWGKLLGLPLSQVDTAETAA